LWVPEVFDEAFSAYVASRQEALLRTAFVLTGDHHAAEDLVQTALARVYVAWNRIREKQAMDAYVRRVMVNEHTNWWRRSWRRREHSTDDLPNVPAKAPDLDPADRDELMEHLYALPPRQRVAIVLRYFEGLSQAEAAKIMNCSEGTVKSHTSRALAALRTKYVEDMAVKRTR
jgi:RNA polymerase sigma-70 factor (sigma-E family)